MGGEPTCPPDPAPFISAHVSSGATPPAARRSKMGGCEGIAAEPSWHRVLGISGRVCVLLRCTAAKHWPLPITARPTGKEQPAWAWMRAQLAKPLPAVTHHTLLLIKRQTGGAAGARIPACRAEFRQGFTLSYLHAPVQSSHTAPSFPC